MSRHAITALALLSVACSEPAPAPVVPEVH